MTKACFELAEQPYFKLHFRKIIAMMLYMAKPGEDIWLRDEWMRKQKRKEKRYKGNEIRESKIY